MTEQAPPDYYFQNIIFNPKYYDNEVNNNITTYEANNTYLKKPINQNTGLINSVLTLTNTTTKEMQWTTPAVAITNYTNYDSTNKTLISNVSGTPTTVSDLVMSGSIGLSTPQKFVLPSNSSTSTAGQVLSILNATTKTTQWITPTQISNFVSYDTGTNKLLNNVNSNISDINNLLISTLIKTPSIQPTGNNNSLTIGNNQTGSSARIDIGVNSARKGLINIGTGTTTGTGHTINIGSGTLTPVNINGPTTITDLVISDSIGSSTPQKFILPSNSSTAINNSVLTINSSNKTTQWLEIPTQISSYVDFNNTTKILNSNVFGNIVDLVISDSIGSSTPQKFVLPSNTSTAINNSVLTINSSNKTTQWLEIPTQISSYVDFNNTTKILNSNVFGNIVDLVISDTIGSSISQKFVLPSNTSSAINGSVLTINSSDKTTRWVTIPTQEDYVVYNDVKDTLISYNSNIFGPRTITDLVIEFIGSHISQKFILPSNSDTAIINSVLTMTDTTTRDTQWVSIPTQISDYVNYSNPNLISNLSGTPTTISNLSIGDFTCTSIDATSGLIQTIGNLQSRGLTIKNTSNVDVSTISNSGAFTCSSINSNSGLIQTTGNLQSRGLTIKNTSNGNVATISNTGALSCTTITTNNNNLNCGSGTISGGALSCTTITTNNNNLNCGSGTITGGSLSCNSINSNNNTITSGIGVISAGSFSSDKYNSKGPTFDLSIGSTQTSGNINIGNSIARTGSVNICTSASNNNINIGNFSLFQQLNINIPIRLGSLVYTNGSEIGFSQNDNVLFSVPTNNPVLPNTRMDTPINPTELINNANYMIKYSLIIIPQVNFNVTRFQYGLYDTAFMTSLSQNPTALSGTTSTLRFDTSDVYSYSGSGFFRYDNTKSYKLSFIMAFWATAPYVQTNIDLIRIS